MDSTFDNGREQGTGSVQFDRAGPFWLADPTYHGVLVDAGALRVSVSPNGKRYVLQRRTEQGWFANVAMVASRDALVARLPGDVPLPDVLALPERPGFVPRPWAEAMKAASDAARRFHESRREEARNRRRAPRRAPTTAKPG